MSPIAIPQWNVHGVLPPFSLAPQTSFDRSPYEVSLVDLVRQYAISQDRVAIAEGFLEFRRALHNVGLVKGFQWVNGSFVEDIEWIERRSPRDIDVVTFYYLPAGITQLDLFNSNSRLFISSDTKVIFHVDAYFVQLNDSPPAPLVRRATYWYSVWSHRRDTLWKGYLELELEPNEDQSAATILTNIGSPGRQP